MSRGKRILRIVFLLLIAGLAVLFIYRWYRKPSTIRVGSIVVDLPDAAITARRGLLHHWEQVGRPRPLWAGLVKHAANPFERELAEMLTSTAFGRRVWSQSDTSRAAQILSTLHQTTREAPSENS